MQEQFWYILGGVVTAITSYLVGREKMKAEVKKDNTSAQREEIDTVKEAILIWRDMAEQFKTEVSHLSEEVVNLKSENETLLKEIEHMRKENALLRSEVEELRKLVKKHE